MHREQETARVGYLECFGGISGDMLLGALVDAGVPADLLHATAASLRVGAELHFEPVDRSGIRSLKASVLVGGREVETPPDALPAHTHEHSHKHSHDHEHAHGHSHSHEHDHSHEHSHSHEHEHSHRHSHEHEHAPSHDHSHDHSHSHEHESPAPPHAHTHGRTLPVIRDILHQARLTDRAREIALRAFELLGRAESKIHGVPLDEVHFHEVGAVDAIVDIACAAAGLDALGVERWRCSPVNVGGGSVACAHGHFPVPAPATAELLKGVPTYSDGPRVELTTPTGAALLRALGCEFGETAPFSAESIGYGAGSRDPARFPNVLRLSIGQETRRAADQGRETVTVLECAVDDLNPQVAAQAAQQLLEAGALDVMRAPVAMKKGRVGEHFTVLCRPAESLRMQDILFAETTTLGIRVRREERVVLTRRWVQIETEFGPVRVKVGEHGGREANTAPEFEDCRRLAEQHSVPLKRVMEAALAAWHAARDTAATQEETNTV